MQGATQWSMSRRVQAYAFVVPSVAFRTECIIQAKNREFPGFPGPEPGTIDYLTPTRARLKERMVGTVVDRETLVEKLRNIVGRDGGLLAPGRPARLRVRRQRRWRGRDRRPKRRRPADDSAAGGRDRSPGSPGWSARRSPWGRHGSLRRRRPAAGRDHHQPDPDEPHPRDRPRRPHRAGRTGRHQPRARPKRPSATASSSRPIRRARKPAPSAATSPRIPAARTASSTA